MATSLQPVQPTPVQVPQYQAPQTPQLTPFGQTPNNSPIPFSAPGTGSMNFTPTSTGVQAGNTNYLGSTIAPTSLNDPVQMAQQAFQTFQAASQPAYDKALRDATQQAAGAGQLGSGQLRSSLGDVAQQQQLALDTEQQTLLQNALQQENQNTYQNVGIAQQQQGFQAQQQATAEQDALARANLGLQATTGLGSLQLGQASLAQQGSLAEQGLGLQAAGLTGQLGGQETLAAKGQDIASQQFQQSFAQNASQFGQTYALQKAQQDLNQQVQTGQLSIEQANQKLAELQNTQQYGLAQAGLTGYTSDGTQTLAGQQLANQQQQFEQSLGLGQQQLASQTQLGQQNLLAQLLIGLGAPTSGKSPISDAEIQQLFQQLRSGNLGAPAKPVQPNIYQVGAGPSGIQGATGGYGTGSGDANPAWQTYTQQMFA